MSISVRIRFEIFKRDGFTCQYCGRKTPTVVLEIDHIIAKANDGTDDPLNLITACWDCNSGKSDKPLREIMTGEDPHDKAIELLERERQLAEYNQVQRQVAMRLDGELEALHKLWNLTDDFWKYVKCYLKDFSVYDIDYAIETAITRTDGKSNASVRYFCGIVRQWKLMGGREKSEEVFRESQKDLGGA